MPNRWFRGAGAAKALRQGGSGESLALVMGQEVDSREGGVWLYRQKTVGFGVYEPSTVFHDTFI